MHWTPLRPLRGLQETRVATREESGVLVCPWDSPGKNTELGCHFLLQCMQVKSESEVAQLCPTLSDPMDCSLPGSSIHKKGECSGLILRCAGKAGNPFQTTQGRRVGLD